MLCKAKDPIVSLFWHEAITKTTEWLHMIFLLQSNHLCQALVRWSQGTTGICQILMLVFVNVVLAVQDSRQSFLPFTMEDDWAIRRIGLLVTGLVTCCRTSVNCFKHVTSRNWIDFPQNGHQSFWQCFN